MNKGSNSVSVQGTGSGSPARRGTGTSGPVWTTPVKKRAGNGPEVNTPEKRRPLTPIQKKPARENEMVGIRQKSKSADEASSPSSRDWPINKVQGGFIAKRKLTDKSVQTDASTDIVTSDEPTAEYWRILAEERREALEETLLENQTLTEKLEALEAENARLNELLEDAKTLAEMINSISDDADESGIVRDDETEEPSHTQTYPS